MLHDWIRDTAYRFGIGLYRVGDEGRLAEPGQLRRFLRHFEIDCVFDVGANAGQYGKALRDVGFDGLILSFEPHPGVFQELKKTASTDPNWKVFELALDSEPREMQFNMMASTQFSSLRQPNHEHTDMFVGANDAIGTTPVMTTTIAVQYPLLKKEFGFSRPYLKMDTQGHDLDVAKGAGETIGEFVGLQSELSLVQLYRDAPNFWDSLNYYNSVGFKLTSLFPNNSGHFPDLLEVDCMMYNVARNADFTPTRHKSRFSVERI